MMDNNGATISSYGYSATPSHAPVTYNGNTLDYDANGNLVDDEDFIYVYNDANQLSEVRYSGNNSLVEKYWYDANGKRIKKQNSDGEFTYYINKYYEIDNGTSTSYFFRDDERVAKQTSESMEWYLSDHIGSTSLMVDENGFEVERTDYFPYGQVRSGGLEKYGFTGQENDADTGLMYYGARYYSPEYRVFVQPDTMLPDPYNPQALNRYAYALNNPVKYTDPSGHYVETAIDLAFLAMDINDIRTGNADKWTYIGLATDVVCAALPGVTGGRLGVQALEETVTHADNVGDLFKLLDKTAEVTATGNKVENIYDAANSVEGLADGINILKVGKGNHENEVRRLLGYNGKNIQINTGHGYNRVHETGGALQGIGSVNEIESAIVLDIDSAVNAGIEIPNVGAIERIVTVNNHQVGYHLIQTQDGIYRVSTYYQKVE
ncbi:hypothetical protein MSSIH_1692 [Methanosarcina siciliae HI350]|uniref:Uncharacterized protein n=1 Tax=Methanosarcina siciliae HI350 TaxID=1434119 RepID=A0A0E3PDY8_9EURY|nr:RHS repeat-associated core domain-containing protein [Methanosarcina siciliae]AKB32382.1 hypothetical protein MSSIH_1692 [Methanosarcina siciliae HI350]